MTAKRPTLAKNRPSGSWLLANNPSLAFSSFSPAPHQPVNPTVRFDTEFPNLSGTAAPTIDSQVWNSAQMIKHNVKSFTTTASTNEEMEDEELDRLKALVPRRSNLTRGTPLSRPIKARIPIHDNDAVVTVQDQLRFYLFLKRWTGGAALSDRQDLYEEKAVGGGDWWKLAHPSWPALVSAPRQKL